MSSSTYHMLRGLLALTVMILASLAMRGVARGQEADAYNIYVASPANGAVGEFPVTYTVNLNNATAQSRTLTTSGLQTIPVPTGVDISSVNVGGQTVTPGGPVVSVATVNGGCWRWCIKCHVYLWPPRVRCWIIVYWDPCC